MLLLLKTGFSAGFPLCSQGIQVLWEGANYFVPEETKACNSEPAAGAQALPLAPGAVPAAAPGGCGRRGGSRTQHRDTGLGVPSGSPGVHARVQDFSRPGGGLRASVPVRAFAAKCSPSCWRDALKSGKSLLRQRAPQALRQLRIPIPDPILLLRPRTGHPPRVRVPGRTGGPPALQSCVLGRGGDPSTETVVPQLPLGGPSLPATYTAP